MPWIKRNLFFVITMVVGLGLSGYCGFLLYSTLNQNAKASDDYAGKQSSLKQLKEAKPFPTEKNLKAVLEDQARVQSFLEEFQKSFTPFPPPPKMDDREFNSYLQKSIAKFGADATNAGVSLNPGYAFGFGAELQNATYPSECIEPWIEELQQMKTILGILYGAKINYLERIKRPQVSLDDVGGDDYTQYATVTNQYGVVTPYTVEFRAFSKEIADVLAGVAASSNCFIVKAPFVAKSTAPLPDISQYQQPAPTPVLQQPIYQRPRTQFELPQRQEFRRDEGADLYNRQREMRRLAPRQPEAAAPAPVVPAGPELIETEKPLYVTLYLDIVNLKPLAAPAPAPAHGVKPKIAER